MMVFLLILIIFGIVLFSERTSMKKQRGGSAEAVGVLILLLILGIGRRIGVVFYKRWTNHQRPRPLRRPRPLTPTLTPTPTPTPTITVQTPEENTCTCENGDPAT